MATRSQLVGRETLLKAKCVLCGQSLQDSLDRPALRRCEVDCVYRVDQERIVPRSRE